MSSDTELLNNRTQGGQQLPRSVVRRGYSFSILMRDITYSWWKNNWLPFEEHVELKGFFYMPLPQDDPDQVLWCELDSGLPQGSVNSVLYTSIVMGVRGRYRS